MYHLFFNNYIYSRYLENLPIIEYIWTILPAFVLFIISIPSLSILYESERSSSYNMTLKIIGNQWYWNYELLIKNKHIELDQYQLNDDELKKGDIRLQEFDNWLYLPINTSIRLLATSNDVIHSWTVPSLGIKLDCIPSRLNQNIINIFKAGDLIGGCNEICGSLHAFMAVGIKSLEVDSYQNMSTINNNHFLNTYII